MHDRDGHAVKTLEEWLETDVRPFEHRTLSWLSQYHFFRDPIRSTYVDATYFFAPADGVVLYQNTVMAGGDLLDIKGVSYTLQDALRDPAYDKPSMVVGIFMTLFDVHVNRVPFSGRMSYRALEGLHTHSHPMLDMEHSILEELRVDPRNASYLRHNQRMVNRVVAAGIGVCYHLLQIADYDVDSIMPFRLHQNHPVRQGDRFSQIRFGSQVDLVVPLSDQYDFSFQVPTGCHVEAGLDPIIKIRRRS